jgi:hypothetical protein
MDAGRTGCAGRMVARTGNDAACIRSRFDGGIRNDSDFGSR